MLDSPFDSLLAKTLRCSRFVQRALAADPALQQALRDDHGKPYARADMLAELGTHPDGPALAAALRVLRRRVVVRTVLRDLNGLADLDEVVTTVSDLAEVAVCAAHDLHFRNLAQRHGAPQDVDGRPMPLLIVGMGKLGGRELNVSSDIDLIFVHASDGTTQGDIPISFQDFHNRLGRAIIAALDELTAAGFVFRVDMRLRPFGDSGPLVVNLDALEHYFITSARPWERYAWLKARVISSDTNAGVELDQLVRPFVYRKYHDYGMIQDLRDLHGQIRAEALRKNRLQDIKVGAGGIREIEFVAQLHQLIRGGRESLLQTRSTRGALRLLAERNLLAPHAVAELQAAYDFLRRLEHRLQYVEDAQTQALPDSSADQALIAEAMGFADWTQFVAALDAHRAVVSREFDGLFGAPDVASGAESADQWGDSVDQPEALQAQLAQQGYAADEAAHIVQRLAQWRASSRYRFLTEKARTKLERLLPLALQAAAAHEQRLATSQRLLDLLEAIDRRDAYLSLLVENPAVLQRAARLAAKSAWAAELLRRHPILLDELLQARPATARADWPRERAWLVHELMAAGDDLERQYELLRHFKQVHTLRLNIADVDGSLDVMTLADELSALADLLLDVALALAWRALDKHAELTCPPGFAIVGYGKLGSKELGYASDLDLVFLYDEQQSIGSESSQRLAQRFNQWLNAMTAGGVLYETDLRLRPDGASGMLVSSLEAFRDYQLGRAWTWEHQALTRARFCAGDARLAERFEAIRGAVLGMPRDRAKLREEVLAMRVKMRTEHPGTPDRHGKLDLKHALGGIIDLEFIVQYLVLGCANRHASLTRNAGNFALLALAGELGLIDAGLAGRAAQAYLAFRARQHLARNNNESTTLIEPEELLTEREAVSALWQQVFA